MSRSEASTSGQLSDQSDISRVACLGGGVIGSSWTALFLAAGKSVALYDPEPGAERRVREAVEAAMPALVELGLAGRASESELLFHTDACDAVEGAQFVQESVPERLELKRELYGLIEPALDRDAIVASSASGLTLTELQAGFRDPSRLVLGHPFNPPHLIPLVEVVGNAATGPRVVERTRSFYASIGKVTIELRREVPGHVANRLQAALWREAISLVMRGVASVEDIDTAVSSGPGLRWAVMGPTNLFHLGAGSGGIAAFCERYAASFERWWGDLGEPHLDEPTIAALVAGVSSRSENHDLTTLATKRDDLLTAVVRATHGPHDGPGGRDSISSAAGRDAP